MSLVMMTRKTSRVMKTESDRNVVRKGHMQADIWCSFTLTEDRTVVGVSDMSQEVFFSLFKTRYFNVFLFVLRTSDITNKRVDHS